MLKKLYWFVATKLFDNRPAKNYECPLCHWDTTLDDCYDNGYTSVPRSVGVDGLVEWEAYWKCPRCGTQFMTDESN